MFREKILPGPFHEYNDLAALQEDVRPIVAITREMHRGAFDYTEFDKLYNSPYTNKDAEVVWNNEGKEFRNAVTGIVVNEIMTKALSDKTSYPPYGLITGVRKIEDITVSPMHKVVGPLSTESSFQEIATGFKDTLYRTNHNVLKKLDEQASNGSEDPVTQAYSRYKKIIEFHNKFLGEQSEEKYINDAFDNALGIYQKIVRNTPIVTKRDTNRKEDWPDPVKVARNSKKIAIKMASLDMPLFLKLKYVTSRENMNLHSDSELLRYNSASESLDFEPFVYEAAYQIATVSQDEIDATHRNKCPALQRFNGRQHALGELYDWYLDVVAQVWEQQNVTNET